MKLTSSIFIILSALGFSITAVLALRDIVRHSKQLFFYSLCFMASTLCIYSIPAFTIVERMNIIEWITHEYGGLYYVAGIFFIVGMALLLINRSYHQGKNDAIIHQIRSPKNHDTTVG